MALTAWLWIRSTESFLPYITAQHKSFMTSHDDTSVAMVSILYDLTQSLNNTACNSFQITVVLVQFSVSFPKYDLIIRVLFVGGRILFDWPQDS